MELKELIKDNPVHFASYRQGFFYYIVVTGTSKVYQFPVPLDDIGTATMLANDKAITYMRWIRKAIEDKTLIQIQ